MAQGKHAPSRHVRAVLVVGVTAGVLVVLLGGIAVSAYRYEESRAGRILPGVSIGGIEVGGMTRAQAIAAVRGGSVGELGTTITVTVAGRTWRTTPQQLGEHAAAITAVDAALKQDRSMGVFSRFWHRFRNSSVNRNVPLHFVGGSGIGTFVDQLTKTIDRNPVDAQLTTDGSG